jgi:hypothetical protein
MKRIQLSAAEARRRVRDGRPATAPAKTIVFLSRQLPLFDKPGGGIWTDELISRAQALAGAPQPLPAYHELLKVCVSCHEVHARGSLPMIRPLRLEGKDLRPVRPPPATKRELP